MNWQQIAKHVETYDEREREDSTHEAQMVFSCVKRMRERFGVTLIAQMLKGSKNKRIQELQFSKRSTYGLMSEKTEKEYSDLIHFLIAGDYFGLTDSQYLVVKVKTKGKLVRYSSEICPPLERFGVLIRCSL